MEFILNDFSISGQFKTVEDFIDSLYENTLPMFKVIQNEDNNLYKTYSAFDCKLFADTTINTFIRSSLFNGYPEVYALKKYLAYLIKEPYWQDKPFTNCKSKYYCEFIGKFTGENPNCFSETLEREAVLISFEHNDYKVLNININKDETSFKIPNSFNKESFEEFLFYSNRIGFSEYLMTKKYPKEVIFANRNNKYFADEPYNRGEISKDDAISIQKDFCKSLQLIGNGVLTSRFSDSIKHKGYTYYEFRCSLHNNREFRIYYYLDRDKLVYFNSLMKKTTSLSDDVKDRTVDLIKEYIKNK